LTGSPGYCRGRSSRDALKGLDANEITGPGGLLTQLAGRVIETALAAELSDHHGYPPGQAPPGGAGNVRNGSTAKTVQTELGPVDVKTSRDRHGTFEPQLVAKRQTRLAGLDEKILDLYAGGMSVPRHREPPAAPLRHHRARPGHDQPGHRRRARRRAGLAHPAAGAGLPDRLPRRADGQGPRGPLGQTRACYLAIGVSVDGEREVLELWWQETEGAKFCEAARLFCV
jgi:putative transposase